jgi:hypothetical protein
MKISLGSEYEIARRQARRFAEEELRPALRKYSES